MCLACLVGMLASCSGSDYLNAIPKKSTALISVDMQQMASDIHAEDKAGMLKSLLHVEDVDKCGIDITEKMYLFESADGNLGLCAKVSSESDVEDWLASLAKQHIASEVKERKGFHFAVLKDSWLVGFSDQALLVMGPVVSTLGALGYSRTAFHPYYGEGWNRRNVYPLLGFENYISIEDFVHRKLCTPGLQTVTLGLSQTGRWQSTNSARYSGCTWHARRTGQKWGYEEYELG